MRDCPEGKLYCPCAEFAKGGLCDWPYRNGMSFLEASYMTELLLVIEGCQVDPVGGFYGVEKSHGDSRSLETET